MLLMPHSSVFPANATASDFMHATHELEATRWTAFLWRATLLFASGDQTSTECR